MPAGIRTTVVFEDPTTCPLVEFSAREEATVREVRRSVRPADTSGRTAEFTADVAVEPDGPISHLFSHGPVHRYRARLDETVDCPCAALGAFGCPVTRYTARGGTLRLVFYADGYEQLRAVVADLRERFPDLDIRRFVRTPGEGDPDGGDSVVVDRGRLTARQREVLEAAFERGYFERPRETNASDLAADLGISPSTFREHLSAAEKKLLGDVLGERR
jgi:hypothetical protein